MIEPPKDAPSELTLARLPTMSRAELEALYSRSGPGPIPDGESEGLAAVAPGTKAGGVSKRIFSVCWQGKIFDREKGELLNKTLLGRIVKAKVYVAESWLDGRDAIVIDYSKTSLLCAAVRDEIRQVGPALYLGFAYLRLPGRPQALMFALDFSKSAL
jgi:hypothetical protein